MVLIVQSFLETFKYIGKRPYVMNIRNIQIFGLKTVKAKYKMVFFATLLLIVVIAVFSVTKSKSENQAFVATGQVVQSVPELTQEQSQTETTEIPSESSEETTQKTQEQQREFFEYPGECAVDIRRAEDDINDIKSYIEQDKASLDQIIKEKDDKIIALNEQINNLILQFPELQSQAETLKSQMTSTIESSYSTKIP